MTKSRKIVIGLALAAMVAAACLAFSDRAQFVLGGAFVNVGYRLQDGLQFERGADHELPPERIWQDLVEHNALASSVRRQFPRTTRHPVMVIVACMDGRIHTEELVGDTRGYYYVIRTAGSYLHKAEMEMLELAVSNGVKVVVFTTHTDCAAEKAAKDPEKCHLFPNLCTGVQNRTQRYNEFLARPLIAERIAKGELLVKWVDLDTNNELLTPHNPH